MKAQKERIIETVHQSQELYEKPNLCTMHSAKIFQNLDKRSTLIFAANSTEQKLSSSDRHSFQLNLLSRNAGRFPALLFRKPKSGGVLGVSCVFVRQNHLRSIAAGSSDGHYGRLDPALTNGGEKNHFSR